MSFTAGLDFGHDQFQQESEDFTTDVTEYFNSDEPIVPQNNAQILLPVKPKHPTRVVTRRAPPAPPSEKKSTKIDIQTDHLLLLIVFMVMYLCFTMCSLVNKVDNIKSQLDVMIQKNTN